MSKAVPGIPPDIFAQNSTNFSRTWVKKSPWWKEPLGVLPVSTTSTNRTTATSIASVYHEGQRVARDFKDRTTGCDGRFIYFFVETLKNHIPWPEKYI